MCRMTRDRGNVKVERWYVMLGRRGWCKDWSSVEKNVSSASYFEAMFHALRRAGHQHLMLSNKRHPIMAAHTADCGGKNG